MDKWLLRHVATAPPAATAPPKSAPSSRSRPQRQTSAEDGPTSEVGSLPTPGTRAALATSTASPGRTTIEVLIPKRLLSKPLGPPLQPLTLAPVHDATAYIIDHLLFHQDGTGPDGKPLGKLMMYSISWEDLPAARMLVRADQVTDYVSPRVLEEYEYGLYRKAQEELRLKKEAKAAKEAAAAAAAEAPKPEAKAGAETAPKKKGKAGRPPGRRRGRPAKNMLEVPPPLVAAGDETPKKGRSRTKAMRVPSLTTPTKAHLQAIAAEDDAALYRQFYGNDDGVGSSDNIFESEADVGAAVGGEIDTDSDIDNMFLQDEEIDSDLTLEQALAIQLLGQDHSPEQPPRKRLRSSSPAKVGPRQEPKTRPSSSRLSTSTPQSRSRTPNATRKLTPTKKSTSKPKTTKKRPAPVHDPSRAGSGGTADADQGVAEPEPDQWVVERIEDVATFFVGPGKQQREFLVRWEGDWPPDQNPSWEPEENLPKPMVRNFVRRRMRNGMDLDGAAAVDVDVDMTDALPGGGRRGGAAASAASSSFARPFVPPRGLSSVPEAFAGPDLDHPPLVVNGSGGRNLAVEDDDVEEMFLVEETTSRQQKQPVRPDVLKRELKMAINQVYRGGS